MQRDLHTGELIHAQDGRRYTILETLGSGGFGCVYRARLAGGSGFVRPVAIKVLHPEAGGHEELSQRFRDEARLLGLLRHRALVQVLDLIPYRDGWALVMEYVPGADVAELLTRSPIPPRCAAEIVAEVASALSVAHAAMDPETGEPLGLIHRDVKPANIRLSPEGEVKLLDFGVAHARFSLREAQTRSLAFGSMGYLAPERLEGTDLPASDIYALGVVLVESLRGAPLGPMPLEPRRHQNAVVNVLTPLWPQLAGPAGQALFGLCEAMLHYNPEWRPTAAVVEDRLREIVPLLPGPWLRQWAPQRELAASVSAPRPRANPADSAPASSDARREDSRPWASGEVATRVEDGRPSATEWVPVVASAPVTAQRGRPLDGTLATARRSSSRAWIWASAGGAAALLGIASAVIVATQAPSVARALSELSVASNSEPQADVELPRATVETAPPSATAPAAAPPVADPPVADPPVELVQTETAAMLSAPSPSPEPALTSTAARSSVERPPRRPLSNAVAPEPEPAPEPAPEPEPQPDPEPLTLIEPEPEPEPTPLMGTVELQGDLLDATLTNVETGQQWKPGAVPLGSYTLDVQISPTRILRYERPFRVRADKVVIWSCSVEAQACRQGGRETAPVSEETR